MRIMDFDWKIIDNQLLSYGLTLTHSVLDPGDQTFVLPLHGHKQSMALKIIKRLQAIQAAEKRLTRGRAKLRDHFGMCGMAKWTL